MGGQRLDLAASSSTETSGGHISNGPLHRLYIHKSFIIHNNNNNNCLDKN
jgi:hypothetical protein